MDFNTLLHAAQRNEKSGKNEAARYYSTKFTPPKKEQRSKQLSANIKKFLAKKEAEEKRQRDVANRKKDELLALRAMDKKATKRVNVMLKRTKSANQSVLEDAVGGKNLSAELAQPDEDDYGYVSKEASDFYAKMMEKYSKMPKEAKYDFSKPKSTNLSSTKDRVKSAIEREKEEALLPHKRKRTSKNEDSSLLKEEKDYERSPKEEEKPKMKPKAAPPPPALSFHDILKMAEKKQFEPIVIPVKPKEEEKLLTKRQKREFDREQEWKERREKGKAIVNKIPESQVLKSSNKAPEPIKKVESAPVPINNSVKKPIPVDRKVLLQKKIEPSQKPNGYNHNKTLDVRLDKDRNRENGQKVNAQIRKVSSSGSSTSINNKAIPSKFEKEKKLLMKSGQIPSAKISANPPPSSSTKAPNSVTKTPNSVSKIPNSVIKTPNSITKTPNAVTKTPNSVVPKKAPVIEAPKYLNAFQKPEKNSKPSARIPNDIRRDQIAKLKKKPMIGNKRRILDDDEDYDSEMDDFIDDGPEDEQDYSRYISEIFGYDKSKYRYVDDDIDNMESTFAQQMREEAISKKIGIMEDLEDIRMEEEEKRRKTLMKKKMKR